MVGGITSEMDMNLGKLWEIVRDRQVWCAVVRGLQRVGYDLVTEQQHTMIKWDLSQEYKDGSIYAN